jgi:hypothetical protein
MIFVSLMIIWWRVKILWLNISVSILLAAIILFISTRPKA